METESKTAVVIGFVLAVMSSNTPAYAQQDSDNISSVSLTIPGLEPTNTEGVNTWIVNLSNCRDFASENPTVEVEFEIIGDPSSDERYVIKVQHGDEACATAPLEVWPYDECQMFVGRTNIPANGEVSLQTSWYDLTNIDQPSACANVSDYYDFILVFEPPAYDYEEYTTDYF